MVILTQVGWGGGWVSFFFSLLQADSRLQSGALLTLEVCCYLLKGVFFLNCYSATIKAFGVRVGSMGGG